MRTGIKRALPLLALLALLALGYGLGLHRLVSWEALGARQAALEGLVAAHPVLAGLAYVLTYAAAVAASFPGAALLTVAGGLLFGTVAGTALAVCGSTLGAVAFFLAVRAALRPGVAQRGGARMAQVQARMARDGFSYMLALRLLPVVPFWLVNIAAALGGVRLRDFAVATLLGVVPAGAVYASLGAGVGVVLAAGGRPDLSVIFSAPVLLPLVGLAVLALLPLVWRWVKGRKKVFFL